jgi:hypothetical protein
MAVAIIRLRLAADATLLAIKPQNSNAIKNLDRPNLIIQQLYPQRNPVSLQNHLNGQSPFVPRQAGVVVRCAASLSKPAENQCKMSVNSIQITPRISPPVQLFIQHNLPAFPRGDSNRRVFQMTVKRIKSFLRRLWKDRSGAAGVVLALSMPVTIGGLGFGAEVGYWYFNQRKVQNSADMAACAGAVALRANRSDNVITSAALQAAEKAG